MSRISNWISNNGLIPSIEEQIRKRNIHEIRAVSWVPRLLFPYKKPGLLTNYLNLMEAGIKELPITNVLSPQVVLTDFFRTHTTENVWDKFLHLFKAWVDSPSANRARFRDEEIALFMDQLIDPYAHEQGLPRTSAGTGDDPLLLLL